MVSPKESRTPRVSQVVARYREAIVGELRAAVERRGGPSFDLMRYHLGWQDEHGQAVDARGGKLLRPALCLLACEATGGDWRRALPGAAALELLHNFTLIHDDVEDASAQRHGRETVWRLWGEAQAINAGDGMFALAHVTLLRLAEEGHSPALVLRVSRMFDEAALHLCAGQHLDLTAGEGGEITGDGYLAMIEGKTAALLAASTGIGALLSGAGDDTVNRLFEFGRRAGLAFQIQDDVLGIWGDADETGKPAGDDLRAGKRSYPVVIGLERGSPEQRTALQSLLAQREPDEEAVARACALLEELGAREAGEQAALGHAEAAIESLTALSLQPEGREELEQLARFAARRSS